ncbi:sensor histidine kinase [Mangrovibacillus cuniculi]|uniref:Sensor histidine kinase n=1 Tax=Mangrovibacillus cuniculi TaxID=2593652 RepID=A0A7S8HEF1_9BACI|nr:sensor histidine kinase [Mangrovibacillus cuniculi]QPC45652.1 sensor histidine kinase [Mangrovibacillus cuniculi]
MNSIQKKILLLTSLVLIFMSSIWITLTYYNNETHKQYNEILKRYLTMNDVTTASQQSIADLNSYLRKPISSNIIRFEHSKENVRKAKRDVLKLENKANQFTLTTYVSLIDSLVETMDRSVIFFDENNQEASAKEFEEATRISSYISEMTLTLLDKELTTYDIFYRGIMQQAEEVIRLGIWLLLIMTAILFIATYWFSLSITRPIQQLTQAANDLSNGRFKKPIKVESNDEIAFLAKTFDRMRININNLIGEIKHKAQLEHELQQNQLLLQEIQFKSLQSQINPHFLFNTLNTLSKKAYLEGSEETSDLLVSVAGILRYNLKQVDRSVSLREEIFVLKQYIEIQKARFTDRLHVRYEIDEDCLFVPIPALTLQPIVENAVIHAVEPKVEGGQLIIRVKDLQNKVVIEIEDDGSGMTPQKMEEILQEKPVQLEGHSTGIGFPNVVKRLRLFFGEYDVIRIESTQGVGTKVMIFIEKRGVKQDDESLNRR